MIKFRGKSLTLLAIILIPFQFYFSSCTDNPGKEKTEIDTEHTVDSAATAQNKLDSIKSAKEDSIETKVEHLSKADSIKIADSVKHTKNPIRDFN